MKVLLIAGFLLFGFILTWGLCAMPVDSESEAIHNNQFISLSEQLLYGVKTETPTDSLELTLSKIALPELIAGLSNDKARKTFWINIYNAWFQILSTRERKLKPGIFTENLISIAGTKFSLDDIEHGILRKYRWKYSMGYLPQFCPSTTIKQLCVSKIDYRIHFALNCGAKSCPPIAFYKYENLDDQLEMATSAFITSETEIDEVKKVVRVSRIMKWFKGDFNGIAGLREILTKYLTKDFSDYKIEFKEYDSTEHLKNFTPENKTQSIIICPSCGYKKEEIMPTDACQLFYKCENCKTVLRPKEGNCCVFCSYGTLKCPSKQ